MTEKHSVKIHTPTRFNFWLWIYFPFVWMFVYWKWVNPQTRETGFWAFAKHWFREWGGRMTLSRKKSQILALCAIETSLGNALMAELRTVCDKYLKKRECWNNTFRFMCVDEREGYTQACLNKEESEWAVV